MCIATESRDQSWAQDEPESDPWHVTATHSGDRTADGGSWQDITIELAEVAPNVHSIYIAIATRNGITLNNVDPEQLEFNASSDSAGTHRRLPCEMPALGLARRTDSSVVARLVRTHRHRKYRDATGFVSEEVVDGWGCQPLQLYVEPFHGLPQHNTAAKAIQRTVQAIQAFLRDEAAAGDSTTYATGRRQAVRARRADYDLGFSTPVRCVVSWRNGNALNISSLMFGWDNRFLPDTYLDRSRNAIEWFV